MITINDYQLQNGGTPKIKTTSNNFPESRLTSEDLTSRMVPPRYVCWFLATINIHEYYNKSSTRNHT